jgi:Reverse transcriptase (RNA-dependent DNA polymerase)
MNQIYCNIEKKLVTAALFIDLSKAFDSLFHPLLMIKLSKLGFSDNFLKLLKSYLLNRKQYVDLNEARSGLLPINKGVFQGSKLAAILFIIYINSICNLPLNGKIYLYADDIAIVYGAPDAPTLKKQMEYDLKVLDIWLSYHYLKMNVSKTNYVLFTGRTRLEFFTQQALNIRLNGNLIERVESFKYLGFWIDEELNFQRHIKHIKSKVIPMTFAIKRIRPFISQNTALQLYFAHINSHLLYMNPFWNNANNNLLETLAVAQRKCLRFIYKRYSYSPSRELFSEQVLPLNKLNEYNLLLLAFKISHNLLVNNVELRIVSEVHRYETRQRNHFYVENFQTRFGFANFFTRGMIAYNNLDSRITNIHSIARFKRELRRHLLEDYLKAGN